MATENLTTAVDEVERAIEECATAVRTAAEREKWGTLADARKAMDSLVVYTLPETRKAKNGAA